MKTLFRLLFSMFVLSTFGCQSALRPVSAPQMKQAPVTGATLNYVEQGQGDPVIFVHGSFSDHRVWEGQRTAISPRYRYIAVDQRYFGTAPWQDNGDKFSVTTHANDLAAFIERLGTGPVHAVGWSYGGTVLLVLAAQRPDLLKSLFLYEPALSSLVNDPTERKTMGEDRKGLAPAVAASKSNDQTKAVQLFSDWVLNQPGGFDGLPPTVRNIFLENSRTIPPFLSSPPPPEISCAQLSQLKVPVTVAKGQQTRTSFSILADSTHRCLAGSRLVVVPDARHMAPVTHVSALNAAILAHLTNR
jgi:pimeloyl-ACP methyl ester carboxylesterase